MAESYHHEEMAAAFAANPATNNHMSAFGTVNHCEYLARGLKVKANKGLALALEHERMVQAAEQK